MTVAMMAYATLVATALALAAWVAEWGLERRGWPSRWVWLAAGIGAIAAPAWQVAVRLADGESAVVGDASRVPLRLPGLLVLPLPDEARGRGRVLDAVLLSGWIGWSGALLARLARRRRRLQLAISAWPRRVVDGTTVLVSEDVGPAVLGVRDPAVVLPAWVLHLSAPDRALVLRHELAHVRGGDAALQMAGHLLPALAPWNPVLWVVAKRLRAAIEVDCDRRVLGVASVDRRRYGELLLLVASRGEGAAPVVPALSESFTLLRRRIAAMTHPTHRSPLPLAASLTIAGVVVVAACNTEAPQATSAPTSAAAMLPATVTTASAWTARAGSPVAPYLEFEVDSPVRVADGAAPRYPDRLRAAGREGEVLVQFVVDTAGRAEMETFQALRASDDAFADAVRAAVPGMRFVPARARGEKVRQLVQQPFRFALAK